MRRGDLVTVAAAGDNGKPRPAVIVQTDAFPQSQASVVVCQLTSELVDAADFRVTIEPKPENGLRLKSQVMADKPVTVRREQIGRKTGRLASKTWLGSELVWRLSWGSRISDASGPINGQQNSHTAVGGLMWYFRGPAAIKNRILARSERFELPTLRFEV